jgi:hypothetical protein
MKANGEVEKLEKVIGQLEGAHTEISVLAKKSPSDALNKFKLDLINRVLASANQVLGDKYMPFAHFDQFDVDDAPSTSDVAMVLAQYMKEAERYRSDNVTQYSGRWYYKINGERSNIQSGPPTKVGKK